MIPQFTKPQKGLSLILRESTCRVLSSRNSSQSSLRPWNYPFILSLLPLVGAIAAGCTCVIKPSEYNPTFSALLTQLIAKYLDPEAYTVVNGAVTETTRLLELRWDHVFYTGGNRVGRIVAAAAAKHITPVTLELGGKSPVFVDASNTDFDIVARRVLWGKIQNAGQVRHCFLLFTSY